VRALVVRRCKIIEKPPARMRSTYSSLVTGRDGISGTLAGSVQSRYGSLGTTFWATLQLYSGKHYRLDLGNLTFISWESRQAVRPGGRGPP